MTWATAETLPGAGTKARRLQQPGRRPRLANEQSEADQADAAKPLALSQAVSVRRAQARPERKHRSVLPQRCRPLQSLDRWEDRYFRLCLRVPAQYELAPN